MSGAKVNGRKNAIRIAKLNGKTNHELPKKNTQKNQPTVEKPEVLKVETKQVILEAAKTKKHIICVDTNVLIYDPNAINEFLKGDNLVCIPAKVLDELDKNKTREDIGRDVREVVRIIIELRAKNNPNFRIVWGKKFHREFDKSKPDHIILATFNWILGEVSRKKAPYVGYDSAKMVSSDSILRITAEDLLIPANPGISVSIEDYQRAELPAKTKEVKIKRCTVSAKIISLTPGQNGTYSFLAGTSELKKIPENEAIITKSTYNPEFKAEGELREQFAAIKKGEIFRVIPDKISACGITAKDNHVTNWEQRIALSYLLDYTINCVFLEGGAGTGKTLLALAAAMEQRKSGRYRRIIIARPAVPLDDQQQIGFLPGDIQSKLGPWISPIYEAINFILNSGKAKDSDSKINTFDDLFSKHGIEIVSLDYIRGCTYTNAFIIIDEAQNLTPHQIKTIATRVGVGTKITFTGDLGQIDNRKLTKKTSGLAHGIHRFGPTHQTGIVKFKETVRSEFAKLADEVL